MPTFHDLNAQIETMQGLITALAEPEYKALRTRLVDAVSNTDIVIHHFYDWPEYLLYFHGLNYHLILQSVLYLQKHGLLDRIRKD